jgi:hypothetical protein
MYKTAGQVAFPNLAAPGSSRKYKRLFWFWIQASGGGFISVTAARRIKIKKCGTAVSCNSHAMWSIRNRNGYIYILYSGLIAAIGYRAIFSKAKRRVGWGGGGTINRRVIRVYYCIKPPLVPEVYIHAE